MFSKGINNLIATLLTMATLLQSSGTIENLFFIESFQNSNINLDVEGDFEEPDLMKWLFSHQKLIEFFNDAYYL